MAGGWHTWKSFQCFMRLANKASSLPSPSTQELHIPSVPPIEDNFGQTLRGETKEGPLYWSHVCFQGSWKKCILVAPLLVSVPLVYLVSYLVASETIKGVRLQISVTWVNEWRQQAVALGSLCLLFNFLNTFWSFRFLVFFFNMNSTMKSVT